MISDDQLDKEAVFRIGKVVSVNGRRVRVAVDKLKNTSHLLYRGGIVRNVAVGSYIKISKGFVDLIAKVDGEVIEEDLRVSERYRRRVDTLSRQLDVSLIGYIEDGSFRRGVREMPLLDNGCYILTNAEFQLVHSFVSRDDTPINIGTLAMEPTQPIEIGINAIFASHIGIFGNTGSGKSYTLTKIYHELLNRYGGNESFRQKAQFLLIDFNGEYIDRRGPCTGRFSTEVLTGQENKQEFALSTRVTNGVRFPLPREVVEDAAFWTVLLDATEKTQAPFLKRVLSSDYWDKKLADPENFLEAVGDLVLRATKSSDRSLDRQTVINLLYEVRSCLDTSAREALDDVIADFQKNLGYNATQGKFFWGEWNRREILDPDKTTWESLTKDKITRIKVNHSTINSGIDLIRFKIVLQYYSDIISGFSNREHLSPLIKRLETRIPDIKKVIDVDGKTQLDRPLIVVSLRDVNLTMRKVIPLLLCKYMYDKKKREDLANSRYLNLIIDEAHNILSSDSSRETDAWRDYRLETFEEIIKEGRKFGVFLTLASQRPHDISPTIISQLHNYFLHRLVNHLDMKAIENAVAYLDRVSFESLPILPTGTCVVAGVATQIPLVVKIGELPDSAIPNSRTMSVTETWQSPFRNTFAEDAPISNEPTWNYEKPRRSRLRG
ncbi:MULTISPECIES: ATP-binding protein [Actinomycetaceae]|uniref:ATP-binding protein n=1 Tax=Actinomycetaceae TaxID=2049 RepID=UPI002657B018|nr:MULTISPECIES: DUF87 domain-containing protein [Actinomycetaceae]MDK7142354.1 DUF87 domain-containing protein [Gleimia europaea]MDU5568819.1 DUF87 domain-containing protein [Actinomyces sp.]